MPLLEPVRAFSGRMRNYYSGSRFAYIRLNGAEAAACGLSCALHAYFTSCSRSSLPPSETTGLHGRRAGRPNSPDGSGLEPDRPYALARPVHKDARTILFARAQRAPPYPSGEKLVLSLLYAAPGTRTHPSSSRYASTGP